MQVGAPWCGSEVKDAKELKALVDEGHQATAASRRVRLLLGEPAAR